MKILFVDPIYMLIDASHQNGTGTGLDALKTSMKINPMVTILIISYLFWIDDDN